VGSGDRELLVGHIDAVHKPRRAHLARGDESVNARAGAEVENGQARQVVIRNRTAATVVALFYGVRNQLKNARVALLGRVRAAGDLHNATFAHRRWIQGSWGRDPLRGGSCTYARWEDGRDLNT